MAYTAHSLKPSQVFYLHTYFLHLNIDFFVLNKTKKLDMIDPDKKVDEKRKKHPSTYQSKENPQHFNSEGDEYLDLKEKQDNDIQENADFDKVYGLKNSKNKEDNT